MPPVCTGWETPRTNHQEWGALCTQLPLVGWQWEGFPQDCRSLGLCMREVLWELGDPGYKGICCLVSGIPRVAGARTMSAGVTLTLTGRLAPSPPPSPPA